MIERPMAVSKGASLGVSVISNIQFMATSNHDGLATGMFQKPDIPKQVAFQDSV